MSVIPNHDLSSCPLAPSVISKLDASGFYKVNDLLSTTPLELSKELSIDVKEAVKILTVVRETTTGFAVETDQVLLDQSTKPQSVLDLLSNEENKLKVVTFCAALDDALGGGIPVQKITEICGTPGVGKTQFGIQLAIDVQIPVAFGGLDGEAIYIDTEGSLTVERVVEVANAASNHTLQVAQEENDEELINIAKMFTLEKILDRIHLFRCLDYVEVIAVSNLLPEFIKSHPKVKIIVIDSIAFHFRQEFQDMVQRTSILQGLIQQFHMLASDHNLAVVIMNQMTTKFTKDAPRREGQLVPALGDSWGHACNNRIILSMKDGVRYANLVKSSSRKDAVAPYSITAEGIRDLDAKGTAANQQENISQMES